ncbi:low temperature requirement protein A [Actinomadura litoris]|uniref:low temperature requirement protein A n=1 Tax=Actinomadura litoris TaxID=2678616 RepID=UPI001C12B15A|nr:low temperature requirement protein A [Actinomadura litoris]
MSAVADAGPRRAVSPLELFFDVVFVFAVGQLAEHLHTELSWRGAAETAVMVVAVLGTWVLTSFDATFLDITRAQTRGLVLAVMGLGLFMNAQIPHAFAGRPWAFVVPLVAILLLTGTTAAVTASVAVLRSHYHRVLIWAAVSVPLWLVGAAVDHDARIAWWAAAAAVDLTGTWLRHPLPGRVFPSRYFVFDAEHMVERIRLFLILQLGETVLTIGSSITDAPVDAPTVAAALGVFVAPACLWATYFLGGEEIVTRQVASTSDPMRSIHRAVNSTYGTLTGLVALAVGSGLVIGHASGAGTVRLSLLMFGGPILYLVAQAWWYYVTTGRAWAARLLACAACAAAGVAARWLSPLVSVLILDVILVVLVIVLTRVHRQVAEALEARGEDRS